MLTDLRHALRQILRYPGFSVVVILTLGLGIGANTAVFSIANSTFLRPLPYADSDRILFLSEGTGSNEFGVSYPNFLDWSARQDIFSALAVYFPSSARLKTLDNVDQVSTCLVSGDFFSVLGLHAALGRDLSKADDRVGAAPVVWATHSAAQKFFSGDRELVGKSIMIDDMAVTIAGILPASFQFHRDVDFYLPIAPYAEQQGLTMRASHADEFALGRLKSGATLSSARTQMTAISKVLDGQYPGINSGISARVQPLRERLAGPARTQLFLLLGAVGMVLLIACVNVGNMMLSRSLARNREMAIRTALGANRYQLIRQLLAESLLLAIFGGVVGTLLGLWGGVFLRQLVPWEMQSLASAGPAIDTRVLLFVLGTTFLTGIGFGLAPAWYVSHVNPNDALKKTQRIIRTRLGRVRLGDILVVAQVTLALMLLVGAGLLIRSLRELLEVPSGINPDHVLTLSVAPPGMDEFQKNPFRFHDFYGKIVDAIARLPEVDSVAAVSGLPFSYNTSYMGFYREGQPVPAPGKFPTALRNVVTQDYFRTMGIPVLRGRTFDGHEPQPVIPKGFKLDQENISALFGGIELTGVISERMAKQFWPGEDPIGKRFRLGTPEMNLPWIQIVGVVGNTTQTGLDQGVSTVFYLSSRQFPDFADLAVRTRASPAEAAASIRQAVRAVANDNPIYSVRLMTDRMAEFVSGRKLNMNLFTFFACSALLLSLVGIYGVLSIMVSQRTREIGIRMALGAQRIDVLGIVLSRGLYLALLGVVLGLAGAWSLSRLLRSQLFGIAGTDPLSYIVCAILLLFAAVVACLVPARRASKVDPILALRAE